MRSNWIRFLAGVLVSVALVGAFAVTGGMKGGRSTNGLLYQASGLHPDGEMLAISGQTVTCEEYLFWLGMVCDNVTASLPDVDWSAAVTGDELRPTLLKKPGFGNLDDMYAAIGYGGFSAQKAVNRIRDELKAQGVEVTDMPGGAKWKRV